MQKKLFWATIEQEIASGNYPAVYITGSGHLALDGRAGGAMLPAKIAAMLPAEVKAKAAEKMEIRESEKAAESAKYAADLKIKNEASQKIIEEFYERRVWGIQGFYMEEFTGPRYTYAELKRFADIYGCRQFGHNVDLTVICYGAETWVEKDVYRTQELFYNFFDTAGTRDRHSKFDFAKIVKDIEAAVTKWRLKTAQSN